MDSSLQLDLLLDLVGQYGFEVDHDYSVDLKSQVICFACASCQVPMAELAGLMIENLEEVLPPGGTWHSDYRGLIQLIIMMLISQKRKDAYEPAI